MNTVAIGELSKRSLNDATTRLMQNPEPTVLYETVRRRKDGTNVDISLAVSPIRDAAGRVIGASKIARDITERKRTEAALQVSEIRYRRLFESAKDGILILDAHSGEITDVNPFMCELMGCSPGDLLGKELWQIGLFSNKSANLAAVQELQEKGYLRYEHLPLKSNHGRPVEVEVEVEVEVVANAYLEGPQNVIQCNIRDITERTRLERQLQQQSAELSNLHRRKDEFLAMLSHELRNPLAPILNAVQLLGLQKNENQIQRQARQIIERQVTQLTHLVDDLMDVSRLIYGRIRLRLERVAVNSIVENAIETARPLIEQRQHELTVSLSPERIWLDADIARLEQVMVNLLANAAKYTDIKGRQTALKAGFDYHMVKPADFSKLMEIMTIAAVKAN